MPQKKTVWIIVFSLSVSLSTHLFHHPSNADENGFITPPGASLEKIADGFGFTEGPAADYDGNIYFSDVDSERIHIWTIDGALSTFRENTDKANGLFFDANGNLIACAGGTRSVVSYLLDGSMTTIADTFQSNRLNMPNDLWVSSCGGVYFTDPNYRRGEMEVDGENVYYITPGRDKVVKVIGGLERPNGIVGNPLTGVLYVVDSGTQQTYAYTIESNGLVSGERLFAEEGRDGMTVDVEGNVYITSIEGISVYNARGHRLGAISVPESTTNACIGGKDHQTLFITTRSSLYSIPLKHKGFLPEYPVAFSEIEECL